MAISKSTEQKWQAESDANTLATYQEIINDKARMQRAIKIAQDQAKALNKRATAMSNVASFKNGGKLGTKCMTTKTGTKARRK